MTGAVNAPIVRDDPVAVENSIDCVMTDDVAIEDPDKTE